MLVDEVTISPAFPTTEQESNQEPSFRSASYDNSIGLLHQQPLKDRNEGNVYEVQTTTLESGL